MSKRHFQLPNDMTLSGLLTPNDLLVYITIKSFYNQETKLCFPGVRTISKKCGFSIPTIRNSIEALEHDGWIIVEKGKTKGASQYFTFKKYKNFEVFSPEFLENTEITAKEKAMLVATQQYMFKDTKGLGKISYNNKELSEKINLSQSLITKRDKSLIDKGLLFLKDSGGWDPVTGLHNQMKIFELDKFDQAIVFTLQEHDNELQTINRKLFEFERRDKEKDEKIKRLEQSLLDKGEVPL